MDEAIEFDASAIRTVLCDLDGVVWLRHEPIPGAVDAIARIRRSGRRVLFVTNNSAAVVADHEAALDAIGVPAGGDVVSSAMAGALLVEPGERVLVAGGPGVIEAVERRGAVAIRNDGSPVRDIDAVMVGLHRDFDFARLAAATTALHAGARLIGTNSDATYPTPEGPEPGGGALVAAIATAGMTTAEIAGKPHPPMAAVIREVLGSGADPGTSPPESILPESILMIGDRPETDGAFAATLGSPFALVRTGVVAPDDPPPSGLRVALDVADLAAVADVLTGPGG